MIRRPRNEHSRPSMNHDNNGAGMQTRSVSVSSSSSLSIAQEAHGRIDASAPHKPSLPTMGVSCCWRYRKSCPVLLRGQGTSVPTTRSTVQVRLLLLLCGQASPRKHRDTSWQQVAVWQTGSVSDDPPSGSLPVPVSQCPSGPHSSPRD